MPYLSDLAIVKHICGGKPEKDYDWRQIQVTWNDWACGCMGQLLTCADEDRQPEGWTVAAGMFLKTGNPLPPCSLPLPPPPNPPLFFIADADYCLFSEESNYWVRGKDTPSLINPHQIIQWLTATECDSRVGRKRRVKRFVNDKEKTKLKVLREAESCSQDRVSGTRHHKLLSPFISLLINSSVAA